MQLILAWRGYASDIKIGIKRIGDQDFEAHAWLVSDRQIVTGGSAKEIAEFVPLAELASGRS